MNHQPMSLESEESSQADALFREYAPQGKLYAQAILGNATDAEEVVQEAFLKILNAVGDRSFADYFQRVFFKTTRNLCIDLIRKQKRNRFRSLEQTDEVVENNGTQSSMALNETAEHVDELMSEMPGEWSSALRLKVDESKSYAEIATELNASHAQVRMWIFRARKFLRDHLNDT